MTIIDIETCALSAEELAPYVAELEYTGTAKDPAKIEAAMIEKRAEFIERAALSAETGRILTIGLRIGADHVWFENETADDAGEKNMLVGFWAYRAPQPFLGHNIIAFDFPYLLRRSWRLGVKPNYPLTGKPWEVSHKVLDTMVLWAAGEYGKRISLNNLARFFGLAPKTGTGDQYAKWYLGGERERAREYLRHDLYLAYEVARRMGVDVDDGN